MVASVDSNEDIIQVVTSIQLMNSKKDALRNVIVTVVASGRVNVCAEWKKKRKGPLLQKGKKKKKTMKARDSVSYNLVATPAPCYSRVLHWPTRRSFFPFSCLRIDKDTQCPR